MSDHDECVPCSFLALDPFCCRPAPPQVKELKLRISISDFPNVCGLTNKVMLQVLDVVHGLGKNCKCVCGKKLDRAHAFETCNDLPAVFTRNFAATTNLFNTLNRMEGCQEVAKGVWEDDGKGYLSEASNSDEPNLF